MSEVIRLEAREADGKVTCVTCGVRREWKKDSIQAGHYLAHGGRNALKFDERNIAPQCVQCNYYRSGAQAEFTVWMLENRGAEVVAALVKRRRLTIKYTRDDLEVMLAIWQERYDKQMGLVD